MSEKKTVSLSVEDNQGMLTQSQALVSLILSRLRMQEKQLTEPEIERQKRDGWTHQATRVIEHAEFQNQPPTEEVLVQDLEASVVFVLKFERSTSAGGPGFGRGGGHGAGNGPGGGSGFDPNGNDDDDDRGNGPRRPHGPKGGRALSLAPSYAAGRNRHDPQFHNEKALRPLRAGAEPEEEEEELEEADEMRFDELTPEIDAPGRDSDVNIDEILPVLMTWHKMEAQLGPLMAVSLMSFEDNAAQQKIVQYLQAQSTNPALSYPDQMLALAAIDAIQDRAFMLNLADKAPHLFPGLAPALAEFNAQKLPSYGMVPSMIPVSYHLPQKPADVAPMNLALAAPSLSLQEQLKTPVLQKVAEAAPVTPQQTAPPQAETLSREQLAQYQAVSPTQFLTDMFKDNHQGGMLDKPLATHYNADAHSSHIAKPDHSKNPFFINPELKPTGSFFADVMGGSYGGNTDSGFGGSN